MTRAAGLSRFADLARDDDSTCGPRVTAAMLGSGTVLAFDQSIRATGWCLMEAQPAGAAVLLAGSITTKTGEQRGWGATLDDATVVSLEVRTVMTAVAHGWPDRAVTVAHEAPPSGKTKSGLLMRPESSALTALGVRLAAHDHGWPVAMLSPQSARRLLTGRSGAEKKEMHEEMQVLSWLVGQDLLTNEGKRDAAAVGLLWLVKLAPRRG